MREYKTPEVHRLAANAKRAAIKAAGGEAYAALLAKERAARALYRRRHPWVIQVERKRWAKNRKRGKRKRPLGYALREKVRERLRDARRRGIEATIKFEDIIWPTHCPVLGIELDYKTKRGERLARNPANPSLDRWDNTRGYVPGNVFVISFRANILKNNATLAELEAIAKYARHGPIAGLKEGLFSKFDVAMTGLSLTDEPF